MLMVVVVVVMVVMMYTLVVFLCRACLDKLEGEIAMATLMLIALKHV